MLRHVDLCSGIGGFALGFSWARLSDPVLFCEADEFCRKVLNKNFSGVPISNDVKELANDPAELIPEFDILTAGYPCQPFSTSGRRKGEQDERHLWPDIRRIVAARRPAWCVFENVIGHKTMGLDSVLSDLASEGYASQSFIIPASAVGAPHRRDRIWIVANSSGFGQHRQRESIKPFSPAPVGFGKTSRSILSFQRDSMPYVCGEHDGIPRGVDKRLAEKRLHALGNAIVPQIAYRIGYAIKAACCGT